MHNSSKNVLFSIIIPMYNASSYIINCITSILNQSYDSYEIVIVDDGSNDNSCNMVEEFCSNKKNVHVLSQKNSGTYNARLNGAKMAHGDYLLFVDADDEIRRDTLSFLNQVLVDSNIELVLFNYSRSLSYDKPFYEYHFNYHQVFDDNKYDLYYLLCTGSSLNNLASKCISKKLFDSVGFQKIDHFCNAEDLYMSLQLIHKASHIHFYNESFYYYRNNEESVTHFYNPNYFHSIALSNALCVDIASRTNSETLLLLSKQRACNSILVSFEEVFQSNNTFDCFSKYVNEIIASDFFTRYKDYRPVNLSLKRNLLYYAISHPFLFKLKPALFLIYRLSNRIITSK